VSYLIGVNFGSFLKGNNFAQDLKEINMAEVKKGMEDFLKAEGADFFYEDGPGRHDWQFWNKYIDRGLKKVLEVGYAVR